MQKKLSDACRAALAVSVLLELAYFVYGGFLIASIIWELAAPAGAEPLRVLGLSVYLPLEARWPGVPYYMGALAEAALLALAFHQAAGVFRTARDGRSPFAAENARRLRAAAVYAGLRCCLPALLDALTGCLYPACPTAHNLNPGALALALPLYALAAIFEYGARLQRREDETL